jgi:hypothetical protein
MVTRDALNADLGLPACGSSDLARIGADAQIYEALAGPTLNRWSAKAKRGRGVASYNFNRKVEGDAGRCARSWLDQVITTELEGPQNVRRRIHDRDT